MRTIFSVLALGALTSLGGVAAASEKICLHEGKEYSHRAAVYLDVGWYLYCNSGEWVGTGIRRCVYEGKEYSPGAIIKVARKEYLKCQVDNTSWTPTEHEISE